MRSLAIAVTIAVMSCRLAAAQGFPLTLGGAALPVRPGIELVPVTVHIDQTLRGTIELVRLVRSRGDHLWRLAETVHPSGNRIDLRAPAGDETLLIVTTTAHAGYLLEGPLRWPERPASRVMSARWRRTIRGRMTAVGTPPAWLTRDPGGTDAWPQCSWTNGADWECAGVPLGSPGLVVSIEAPRVFYALAPGTSLDGGVEAVGAFTAAWGRFIVIDDGDPAGPMQGGIQVGARHLLIPRARPQASRVESTADGRVRVASAGAATFWVSGLEAAPDDGWVEIGAAARATERIDLRELSAGRPDDPVRIRLAPPAPLAGHVTAGIATPAPGSIVTLYRFVHTVVRDEKRLPPLRVAVAEARTDSEGAFSFPDLAAEPYEAVALHPSLGRGVGHIDPDGQEIEIALRRPSQATGRVLRDGAPAAGVAVAVMPDLAQFAAADDVTEVRGGETQTDAEGRFTVGLAAYGMGELRIGDARTGVRRVPLGPAETLPPLTDLGTIELSSGAATTFVLEGSDGCELLISGPIGRTGLAVVRAARIGPAMFQVDVPEPGRWQIVAVCAGRERAVVPSSVDVAARAPEIAIRLTWAR